MQEFLDFILKEKNTSIYGPASTGKTFILVSAHKPVLDSFISFTLLDGLIRFIVPPPLSKS